MDPKSTNPDDEHVLLNTPYSLQTEAGQKTNANDYGDIISSLSKEFNIYLTDIYKAYFLKYVDFFYFFPVFFYLIHSLVSNKLA